MLTKRDIEEGIQRNYEIIQDAEKWIEEETDIERRLKIISFVSLH